MIAVANETGGIIVALVSVISAGVLAVFAYFAKRLIAQLDRLTTNVEHLTGGLAVIETRLHTVEEALKGLDIK